MLQSSGVGAPTAKHGPPAAGNVFTARRSTFRYGYRSSFYCFSFCLWPEVRTAMNFFMIFTTDCIDPNARKILGPSAPCPAGVVYIQHPGEEEKEMREHFRRTKSFELNCLSSNRADTFSANAFENLVNLTSTDRFSFSFLFPCQCRLAFHI